MLKGRIDILQHSLAHLPESSCVLLALPEGFPSLDAVVLTHDKVVGIQTKSKIEESTLKARIQKIRSNVAIWKKDGCDLLGSDGLLIYMVGIESAPENLQLTEGEVLVTAGQLREHFLDVFFRFGLTGGEGGHTRGCDL